MSLSLLFISSIVFLIGFKFTWVNKNEANLKKELKKIKINSFFWLDLNSLESTKIRPILEKNKNKKITLSKIGINTGVLLQKLFWPSVSKNCSKTASKQEGPKSLRVPDKKAVFFPYERTAFLLGSPIFFGPSCFEVALVMEKNFWNSYWVSTRASKLSLLWTKRCWFKNSGVSRSMDDTGKLVLLNNLKSM